MEGSTVVWWDDRKRCGHLLCRTLSAAWVGVDVIALLGRRGGETGWINSLVLSLGCISWIIMHGESGRRRGGEGR